MQTLSLRSTAFLCVGMKLRAIQRRQAVCHLSSNRKWSLMAITDDDDDFNYLASRGRYASYNSHRHLQRSFEQNCNTRDEQTWQQEGFCNLLSFLWGNRFHYAEYHYLISQEAIGNVVSPEPRLNRQWKVRGSRAQTHLKNQSDPPEHYSFLHCPVVTAGCPSPLGISQLQSSVPSSAIILT